MYPFIKVQKKNQGIIFNVGITVICVLIFLYWLLSGLTLQTNSAVIYYNTVRVENDESKIEVQHINEDNKVFLDDGTSFENEDIKEYIKVVKGSGTYYIPDGLMTVEVSKDEATGLAKTFILMDVVVFIMFICLLIWKHNKRWQVILEAIGYFIISFFASIVIGFWCSRIYLSGFRAEWVEGGKAFCYMVLCLVVWFRRRS